MISNSDSPLPGIFHEAKDIRPSASTHPYTKKVLSRAVRRYICMCSSLCSIRIGENNQEKALRPTSLMFPFRAFYMCQSRLAM